MLLQYSQIYLINEIKTLSIFYVKVLITQQKMHPQFK